MAFAFAKPRLLTQSGLFHLRPNQPGRALRDRRAGMSRHKLRSWSANGIPPAPQQA